MTEPEILFVDDEPSIRLTLPLMLQSYGFKVISAATVAEALRLMAEHRFDVLISDMNIDRPGDGFTVASAMRSTQPHAVRFILTGYPDIDSALKALREDVDDYLIKPTEIEELVARITSRVQKRTSRQATDLKRLNEIIRREAEFITERWLELAKTDTELSSLQLSDPERTDHIPALLQLTVELLASQGENIRTDHQTAPRRHGERRYKQGYASAWLVREAKLLQDAIGDCIQRNLLEIELSMLTPDMVRAFGILQMFVEESLNAFQEKAESPKNRRK